MPKNILSLLFLFFVSFQANSQEKFTISGVISDGSNKETLIGVSIFVEETKSSISTNEYGFYSITLPKGDYTIVINYIGYQTIKEKISLFQNTKKNILLSGSSQMLDEVVVVDNALMVNDSMRMCRSVLSPSSKSL